MALYDLKQMYIPPNYEESKETDFLDIVFIHGLGGNLQTTWKITGTHDPWIENPEFLGPLKDQVRTLSFGYNANRFQGAGDARIIHHANDLLRHLVLKRLHCPNRPLVFICHSLGGLIAKKAILLCARNADWEGIQRAVKSMIFLGTPHQGSSRAKDLVLVQKLFSLATFKEPVGTQLTSELECESNTIQDINMEFTWHVSKGIELLCCYETLPQRLPNRTKEILVPKRSAELQGNPNSLACHCTHSELPKFQSPGDPRFVTLWLEVQRIVRSIRSLQAESVMPPTLPLTQTQPDPPPYSREDHRNTSRLLRVPRQRRNNSRKRRSHNAKSPKPTHVQLNFDSSQLVSTLKEAFVSADVGKPSDEVQIRGESELEASILVKDVNSFLSMLRFATYQDQGLGRERPHFGTCKWIQEDVVFERWWSDVQENILFVTGDPGCGKSNLAKQVEMDIEQRLRDEGRKGLVVSFYFDISKSSNVRPALLDHLIRTLLYEDRRLFHNARHKCQQAIDLAPTNSPVPDANSNALQFQHLLDIMELLVTTPHSPITYLLIDGLDQSGTEFAAFLLRGLGKHFQRCSTLSKLKVLITSRDTQLVRSARLHHLHVHMLPSVIERDISHYVGEEIQDLLESRRICSVDWRDVSSAIVKRCRGSFLFASSVLERLWQIDDTAATSIMAVAESCPPTMEDMYKDDMNRLRECRPDLHELVQYLCVVQRNLTVDEARQILRSINSDITTSYDLHRDLLQMCPRLINPISTQGNDLAGTSTGMQNSPEFLELLHQTVLDYVVTNYDLAAIHHRLAMICMQALAEADWDSVLTETWINGIQQMPFKSQGLLDYATESISHHFRLAGEASTGSGQLVFDFVDSVAGRDWQRYEWVHVLRYRIADAILDPAQARGIRMKNYQDATEFEAPARSFFMRFSIRPPLITICHWGASWIIMDIILSQSTSPDSLGIVSYFWKQGHWISSRKHPKRAVTSVLVNVLFHGKTALHYAALYCSYGCVQLLRPFVDDIDLPDDTGNTPLIYATISGCIETTALLIDAGADVNWPGEWQRTPLITAIMNGNTSAVPLLLRNGAQIGSQCSRGQNALEHAMWKNDPACLLTLLKTAENPHTVTVSSGLPPAVFIFEVARENLAREDSGQGERATHQKRLLSLMLPYIDVDQYWGPWHLLHRAICLGWSDIAMEIIALSSELNAPLRLGSPQTSVTLAIERDQLDVVKALLARGAKPDSYLVNMTAPIHIAIRRNDSVACMLLLSNDCRIDALDEAGRTALYYAVWAKNYHLAEVLISHGADPNLPVACPTFHLSLRLGDFGMTRILFASQHQVNLGIGGVDRASALGIAASCGFTDLIDLLLDHKADFSLREGCMLQTTPLQLSIYYKHSEVSMKLLELGASPLPIMKTDINGLYAASFDGRLNLMEAVVAAAARDLVDLPWTSSGTPLFGAALGGQLGALTWLLDRGANPEFAYDKGEFHGMRLVHAAAAGGSIPVIERALQVTKDQHINTTDNSRQNTLFYALHAGQVEMVKWLLSRGVRVDRHIMKATTCGNSDQCLNLLLQTHSDVDTNSTDEFGRTPLMRAAARGHDRIVSRLLKAGANLLDCDIFGQNVLQNSNIRIKKTSREEREITRKIVMAAMDKGILDHLLESQDIFQQNVYDLQRSHIPQLDKVYCFENIVQTCEDLLANYADCGPRWEILGKFLLSQADHTMARVALQRGLRVLGNTPIRLQHQTRCAYCQDWIHTTRYTCMTCADADFCVMCVQSLRATLILHCSIHPLFAVSLHMLDLDSDGKPISLGLPNSPEGGADESLSTGLPIEDTIAERLNASEDADIGGLGTTNWQGDATGRSITPSEVILGLAMVPDEEPLYVQVSAEHLKSFLQLVLQKYQEPNERMAKAPILQHTKSSRQAAVEDLHNCVFDHWGMAFHNYIKLPYTGLTYDYFRDSLQNKYDEVTKRIVRRSEETYWSD